MGTIISFFLLLAFVVSLIYFFMLTGWYISWKLFFKKPLPKNTIPATFVTVILPVRNEEINIEKCLDCLTAQNYPAALLEIIVSDDFSTDNTVTICKNYISSSVSGKHKIKLIKASEDFGNGKKAAIKHAIHHSKGELIITTDADCTMGTGWVDSYVQIFEASQPKMITGFVKIINSKNFFSSWQALEFLSLSASAAMNVIREKPIMCNGANLAYTKSAYLESEGKKYGSGDASGDDTYLMLHIAEKNASSILFNKNHESIVATNPSPNLTDLISQRVRWASKVRNYKEGYIKWIGILIFILNFTLILFAVLALIGFVEWQVAFALWIFKLISDLFVLVPACLFATQKTLLLLILPSSVIYPFYYFAGVLLSIKNTGYTWKNRTY